ncbi:MAG: alcohol dehydrogenase catalytic domain-containing protein [Gemmatimonadota bacterium]
MRALTISTTGSLDAVECSTDVAVPVITGPGQVRVRLRAAALNHLNLWAIRGLPGVTVTPKWVLGSDGTGVIEEVSDDVSSVQRGDRVVINAGLSCRRCEYCLAGEHPLCVKFRVLGEQVPGTFAEQVVLPATNVRAIPPGVSDADAGAFGLAALTAWRMLVSRAQIRAGDEVLIWGIGGGVAQAALLIAKALGADELINHSGIDVGREVRARTGKRGVNVVVDSVGTATWEQSLGALGRAGRLVTCGGTSGHLLQMDVRKLFWNQWTIMGSTMGSDGEFDAVVAELVAGRLSVPVDSVFPLARGRDALERLEGGMHFGKIVLQISP